MRRRGGLLAAVVFLLAACGPAAPAALPLGTEAVVRQGNSAGDGNNPVTDLAVTALAVRPGTIAELEAGGFSLDEDEKSLVPMYVDARFENKGSETISRQQRVGMENQDGDLINAVAIIDLGGEPYEPCADNRSDEDLAPGDSFESCTLFLLDPGESAARVSFLPFAPGVESDWVYWNAK